MTVIRAMATELKANLTTNQIVKTVILLAKDLKRILNVRLNFFPENFLAFFFLFIKLQGPQETVLSKIRSVQTE